MWNWLTPGVGAALGGAAAGLFGYKGAKEQNVASAQQAQSQMDFQREMSNTAVQRRMADLKKAGINPILAGSKEASTPAGAMAPQFNKAQAALSNLGTAATIANTIAQTNLTSNKSGITSPAAALGNWLNQIMEKLGFDPDSERNIANANEFANSKKKSSKGTVAAQLGSMDYWIDSNGKKWTNKEMEAFLKKNLPKSGF
jgi:hypothetical protein